MRRKIVEGISVSAAAGVVLVALLACTTWSDVKVVTATQAGGELALLGNREEAWQKARVEMTQACGGLDRFEVLEEYDAALVDGGSAAMSAVDRRIRYACVVRAQQPGS